MYDFLTGVLVLCSLAASLFFLRFWRQSRERLFVYFGLAFLLLAINRITLINVTESAESHTLLYLVRLLAFVILLAGILDMNWLRKK